MEDATQNIPIGLEEAVQTEDARGPIYRLLLIMEYF